MNQFLARAGRANVKQLHCLSRGWIFIVIRYNEELRQLRRLVQKLDSRSKRLSRDQYERLHLGGVLARGLDRIINAQEPGSAHTNDITLNSGLRGEELECGADIRLRLLPALGAVRSGPIVVLAAAFAVAATVYSQGIDTSCCQLLRHIIPRITGPVALMEQQNAWTRFCRGKKLAFNNVPSEAFRLTTREVEGFCARARTATMNGNAVQNLILFIRLSSKFKRSLRRFRKGNVGEKRQIDGRPVSALIVVFTCDTLR